MIPRVESSVGHSDQCRIRGAQSTFCPRFGRPRGNIGSYTVPLPETVVDDSIEPVNVGFQPRKKIRRVRIPVFPKSEFVHGKWVTPFGVRVSSVTACYFGVNIELAQMRIDVSYALARPAPGWIHGGNYAKQAESSRMV